MQQEVNLKSSFEETFCFEPELTWTAYVMDNSLRPRASKLPSQQQHKRQL